MYSRDLKNDSVVAASLNPAARTASANGTGADLTETVAEFEAIVSLGAVTGTGPTLDIKFQESDALAGTYTDISGATMAQLAAANANSVVVQKFTGRANKFVRAVATIAGTSPNFLLGVNIVAKRRSA